MINNKDMKNTFLIFSLISLLCSPVFAVPDTITGGKITVTVYDDSYDRELFKKLDTAFWNKYTPVVTKTKDCTTYTYNFPLGAYGKEVLSPYALNKQKEYKQNIILHNNIMLIIHLH